MADDRPLDDRALALERVTALLYMLARDHMPSGTLVGIVNELAPHDKGYEFSSPHLEGLAKDLCEQLTGARPEALAAEPEECARHEFDGNTCIGCGISRMAAREEFLASRSR